MVWVLDLDTGSVARLLQRHLACGDRQWSAMMWLQPLRDAQHRTCRADRVQLAACGLMRANLDRAARATRAERLQQEVTDSAWPGLGEWGLTERRGGSRANSGAFQCCDAS